MINPKIILFTLTCFLLYGTPIISQNKLVIDFNNNITTSTDLTEISKLSFTDGKLIMSLNSGLTNSYIISDISKLLFNTQTDVLDISNKQTNIIIYPNPATSFVRLKNITENSILKIYNLSGSLIKSLQLQDETQTVDILELPRGFYLVKTNNQTIKFLKL